MKVKKNHFRFEAALCLLLALCLVLPSCKSKKQEAAEPPKIEGCATQHEQEFGGIYIEITIDDFNKLGFTYGDSVNIEFSNGFKLEDIPYYNGYYVDAGDPLLVAYPGYDYIKAAVNYGDDLWETGNLKLGEGGEPEGSLWLTSGAEEHTTASIYLNEKGKYANIQDARDIHYSDEREKFDSDEIFANFRSIHMGGIRDGVLYRSASPCDNQHNRAPYVDRLIEAAGVRCIMNLADNEEKIEGYIQKENFDSPYFLSLYEGGGLVIPLALNMNYYSTEFRFKIARGFEAMAQTDGPYLIHCTEGKDRTGFVCMLIEALAGASYQEIVDDYMLTYDNYYKITQESDKTKYDTILEKNLIDMMHSVIGDKNVDPSTVDLSQYARAYLIDAGMEEEMIDALLEKLS